MPGLAGFIAPHLAENAGATLGRMVAGMGHEEFYATGTHLAAPDGLAVGWVSHRDAYADCLPIWNETGDVGLFFSGEHYADPSESQRLRAAGHQFADGDASCLVHLYEEHGPDFFRLLNGTFSGVLLDRRQHRIVLFNDRYGLGRVYIHEAAGTCYFASEAKALLQVRPELRRLDPRGLGELLVCGCPLQDRTLFSGIGLLPPGSCWTFSPGQPVRRETYFDRRAWEAQTPLEPEAYYEALKTTFDRILPRYFQGRQRVALSLTGGLDSRMIIAGMPAAPQSMPCYTFGGMFRESEDVKVSRMVADRCRQPHQVIRVDERFFPHFLELARKCVYITDGTMDVSGAVGLYVNRLGREIAPVRMTGNYGSEILRESVAFKANRINATPFATELAPYLDQAAETYRAEKATGPTLSFIAFKQVPWHHFARFAEEQSQLVIRAPYLDNDLVPLGYRAPAGLLLNKQIAYRYVTEKSPVLAGVPTDRGLLKRPRLLPRRAFVFAKEFRPRAEYCFDYGMPHWLARVDRVIAPLHLERWVLGQQKYYHFRTWYRHELAGQVKAVLLDPTALSRTFLRRREVEILVDAHTRGTANFTTEIHKLMTCELIQRHLLDAAADSGPWK